MNKMSSLYRSLQNCVLRPAHPIGYEVKPGPLFVVGSGRCGTTLLRRLLLEDPRLFVPPEMQDTWKVLQPFLEWYRHSTWKAVVRGVLGTLAISVVEFESLGVHLGPVAEVADVLPREERSCGRILDVFYRQFALQKVGRECEYWVDKKPRNFYHLFDLMRLFPTMKVVHLVRDPRDVVASTLKAKHLNTVEEAAEHCADAIHYTNEFAAAFPDSIMTIRYEDFVEDSTAFLEQIYDFWGIGQPSTIEQINSKDDPRINDVTGAVYHQNIIKPANKGSIGKYKESLSQDEIQHIQEECNLNMSQYGYEFV